ncbi:DNA sulfur modification protein DndD [Pseudoalteromonas translucida]|uniref:ABC transporter ATP-binding protein n=1 Tax=Pseudoalteromonas translucida (strain TAC 125) TaxID=326442 RepID=Q3ICV9_PSET1|nr:DNA sulfur modification protein DndD [Pseudoalteromonas translucida]CAI89145.1 putative ABC transporter ATP-binding protein [Pseudoalteromonas translucida]
MIIKQLTLENFGIYQGRHEVNLSTSANKPIILFGGLNGGGKTTFLDALQLVLYGKHAKCSNRGHQSYGNYLISTKNRYVGNDDTVEISLTFTHTTDTTTNEFVIVRSWKTNTKDVKDKVVVYCNQQEDSHLSQYWDEFVNEFIPLSLSDLFFFDGEKIENLAHPDRSADLIKTGIENLLGLDLLSQLQIDLNNVERKRKSENLDTTVVAKVEALEAEITEQTTIVTGFKTDIANLEKRASDTNLSINKARQKVRSAGAHLIEERDIIKFELGAIEEKLKANLAERVKLDAGCGPLGLIPNLISSTKAQIKKEEQAVQANVIQSAITEYEATITQTLVNENVPETALSALSNKMATLAKEREELASTECYIASNIAIFNGLDEKIANDKLERSNLLKARVELFEQQALFNKKLESIPDYETVQHLLSELAGLEVELKNSFVLIKQKQQLLQQAQARDEVLNTRYANLLTQQSKDTFEQKRSIQVADHIGKLKNTMKSFADELIRENVTGLEEHIAAKFFDLSRKNNLITGVKICPDSFKLTLLDNNKNPMSPSRLSAGERQLLAIAILWGLAEASGKEIPTVIDTPLGRLDGKHRSKLINNYFPKASSQVILLSTDEEITGQYYTQLKPAICREYHISYNEHEQTSTFTEGYF